MGRLRHRLRLLGLFFLAVGNLLLRGVGIFGNNNSVNWGLPILNYMWWLGIGHAGTFISALLLLIDRPWRNSLNRLAELMTLLAVICAGIFPILHLGRPWLFYWSAPYPATMDVWPQFRSPTAWDFFAVLAYLLFSLLFLYVGAIPDFACARDRATRRVQQVVFGLLALGWRGAGSHWVRWRRCYRFLALLAVPLVSRYRAATRSCSRSATRPAGIRRCFRPTSSPAQSFPASRWLRSSPAACATCCTSRR